MSHDHRTATDCLRAVLTAFRTGSPRPLDGFFAPDYVRHDPDGEAAPVRADEWFYRVVGGRIVEGWHAAPRRVTETE